jgi:PII-like signaling protein
VTGGGEMLELRFYFGERDRCGDGPLEAHVMDACARHGVAAAALLRAVEGFGAKHRLRTERLLSLSEDPPLVTVAVGEAPAIEALAAEVSEVATEGLLTVNRVTDAHSVRSSPRYPRQSANAPEGGAEVAAEDEVRVTVWGPRTGPASPHLGAVAAFHRHGAEAATVLLGVDGVIEGERRRARFVAGNRGVPAMTVAIGRREAIDAALAEVDGSASLVTVEGVETYRRIETVSLHTPAAARVTMVTSEIATSGAHPRYLDLIRELRREGAAGATALRGVWGFRGGGEPHGDRVLALRRDVPMIVEAIDAPDEAARWLEIASQIAGDEDVVTAAPVGRRVGLGA